ITERHSPAISKTYWGAHVKSCRAQPLAARPYQTYKLLISQMISPREVAAVVRRLIDGLLEAKGQRSVALCGNRWNREASIENFSPRLVSSAVAQSRDRASSAGMSNNSQADDRPLRKWRGSSSQYLLARLKEAGRDDLIAAIEARRISARSAAVGMGWLREYEPKGAGDNRTQRRQFEMTEAFGKPGLHRVVVMQELTIGPGQMGSVFSTREEAQAAWAKHRDEILSGWDHLARRPMGFYAFEVECSPPDYDIERSTLWRLGVLSEEERAAIEDEWLVEFQWA